MKKITLSLVVLVLLVSAIAISCNSSGSKKPVSISVNIGKDDMIKRGEYLVNIIGCDDCHTPKKMGPNGPEPDMDSRFSGHLSGDQLAPLPAGNLQPWLVFNHSLTAAVGPWGISYASNLSSDETGLGKWTEQQFLKALREGKYKGLDSTRPLLPPMPWQNFAKASDDDLKAIFSFLKSTKPVKNVVPAPVGPDKLAMLSQAK